MKKRQLATLCLVGAWMLAALTGCARIGDDSSTGDEKLNIAVIPKSMGAEFWNNVERGARDACKKLNVEMEWQGPLAESQIAEQNKIIENMITLDLDGIALAPLNPKAQKKPVQTAVDAGIPVVIFDSGIDGDAHVSFVATNNVEGGAMGAQHMAELLGEKKGRVMVMRFIQGTASTEARAKGFIETAKAAGIEIVADPFGEDATVAGCKKTASNTLENYIVDRKLELDGIFACNDRASLGVSTALDDLRKGGIAVDLKFIGFDFTSELVKGLQEGTISALVVQNPKKMGYLAVETLVKHLRKEPIEKLIDTGAELATRERLEKEPELRQLVGLDK